MIYGLYLFSGKQLQEKLERENMSINIIKNLIGRPNEKNQLEDRQFIVKEEMDRKLVVISDKKDDEDQLNVLAQKVLAEKKDVQKSMQEVIETGIHGILLSFLLEGKRGSAINKL
ncbi:MAG: hypothetical protein ACFFCQ_10990, partial [Promethearchaeota archaeon]